MLPRLNMKVFAYIVRADGRLLAALTHNREKRGNYEVVRGRVERSDESLEAAARREVWEESGIQPERLALIAYLGIAFYFDEEQHAYAFRLIGDAPERFTHVTVSHDEDHGMVFEYCWLPMDATLADVLVEGCDKWAQTLVDVLAREQG